MLCLSTSLSYIYTIPLFPASLHSIPLFSLCCHALFYMGTVPAPALPSPATLTSLYHHAACFPAILLHLSLYLCLPLPLCILYIFLFLPTTHCYALSPHSFSLLLFLPALFLFYTSASLSLFHVIVIYIHFSLLAACTEHCLPPPLSVSYTLSPLALTSTSLYFLLLLCLSSLFLLSLLLGLSWRFSAWCASFPVMLHCTCLP